MFAGKKQPLQEKIYISPFQLALICSIMKASEKETGGQTLSASNIAVFTGLFDPVTVDQISCCLSVSASENADLILLCLTEGSAGASAEDRWRMLTAACAGNKRMLPVSLIQQHLDPTDHRKILKHLHKAYPDDHLFIPEIPDVLSGDSKKLCPAVEEYCLLMGLYGAAPQFERIAFWMSRLFRDLKPHRYSHSLCVARTAKELAFRFGSDPVKAEEAGLLHDCAKCLPLNEMQHIARKHHLTEDPAFLSSGALLHSVTGAWVAKHRYQVEDPEILEAIACHNTGRVGMSRLSMCVCLGDFIEPNREPFPGLDETRRLSEVSLEKALLFSLECTRDHVLSRNNEMHPATLQTIEWLKSLS
jgi:predicted HD superfamily hydrolase involved in NAD metabolism